MGEHRWCKLGMYMIDEKLDKIRDDVVELKVTSARQDESLQRITEILDRLTSSVEEHVKRSDNTDKMVALLQAELEHKKQNDKTVLTVLAAVGAVFLALKQLGILDKLF